MRDNFSQLTKNILARRVAYKCCFPDCLRITIGPQSMDGEGYINMGQAAHIHAASEGGPRYVSNMTRQERSSAGNGIWMCLQHAKLIDADHDNYTAETIKQWKKRAETETYRQLKDLAKDRLPDPTTLVCLALNLMFEGVWKSSPRENVWTFTVKRFVWGNEQLLREYRTKDNESPIRNYIIVETQNDGRLLKGEFIWVFNEQLHEYEVTVEVLPKMDRISPQFLGAVEICEPEGSRYEANPAIGDGISASIRHIEENLSLPLGAWKSNIMLGSLFSFYYQEYQKDQQLLNRIIKIELIRLMSIPAYQLSTRAQKPQLNFIKQILEIDVREVKDGKVPFFLSLEWGDGSYWSGDIYPKLYDGSDGDYILPEYIREIFAEKPLSKFRRLRSRVTGEDLREKISFSTIYKLFTEVLPAIKTESEHLLEREIFPYFLEYRIGVTINNNSFEYNTSVDLEATAMRGDIRQFGLVLKLAGYKKGGTNSFDLYRNLSFFFEDHRYGIGSHQQDIWFWKLYHVTITDQEILQITEVWFDKIVATINGEIEKKDL